MNDSATDPYTKIPNALLDTMSQLGNAELRVLLAIIRKTAGWGKECDVISVSQIAKATGLTSRNTQRAITALLEKGFIAREQAGKQTYCYTLKPYPLGTQLDDHIPTDTVSIGDTEPYPLGTQLEVKPYPLGTTQKKESKEKKERDVAPRKTRAQRPHKNTSEDDDVTPVAIRQTLADICGLDLSVCTKESILQVNRMAKRIYTSGHKANKSDDEIVDRIRYFGRWFSKNDWRGKKGEHPTPSLVVNRWGAAMEDYRAPALNGHSPPPVAPPDTLSPTEVVARIAQQQKGRT